MRRPVPAIVFLLALALLTGLVWVRVLHRTDTAKGDAPKTSSSATCHSSAAPVALPKPSQVRVADVLNSTNRDNLAYQVRAQFHSRGFVTGSIGNASPTISGVAEIRYGPSAVAAARLVQIYLPGSTLKAVSSTTDSVVVALGDGYKSLASDSAVSAAQKSPQPVATCSR